MITLRRAAERGGFDFGWLDTKHTFSFGEYHDPEHMGFRSLRVINDDKVAPGEGFPTHGHRDMEIITYVLAGALEHKDSLGTGSIIRPGEVQRMSAGTGIQHSEFNPLKTEPLHLLQIWILPERRGTRPSYEQKAFSVAERTNRLRLVASRDGRDGSVTVHQDVSLHAGLLDPGAKVAHTLGPGRHAWLHVARGKVRLGEQVLEGGDGVAVSNIPDGARLELEGVEAAEVLVFDLA
jgi:redox-sensitive bicupin YhaK (pirin superfamily)